MDAAPWRNRKDLSQQLRSAGPYLLLELLLPGGTLFALLLFVYRNRLATHRIRALEAPAIAAQAIARVRRIKPAPQRLLTIACGTVRCASGDSITAMS